MLKVTFAGLAARKLRTALTATAVVLGVALISGTFILTDAINKNFDSIFSTATSGFDVAITPKVAVESDFEEQEVPPISDGYIARAEAVDGVDRAVGEIFSQGVIYKKNGDRITKSAPNFIASVQPEPFDPFDYVEGRAPEKPGEVAIDRFTANKQGFDLGDTISVSGDGPRAKLELVGIAKYGEVDSIGGASIAIVPLAEAQRLSGKPGGVDQIDVTADRGVAPAALVKRLRRELPGAITIRTAKAEADKQARDIKDGFAFLTTALLVFAGIALFVGGFMIFNTFTITIAQRMREFALLRTLGASRAQVLRSVLLEAFLIGLGASVLGLFAGTALAPALNGLFSTFGLDLPGEGTIVATRTIVVSLVVGTLVTVVSSLAPALRSTRVPPIAALREGAVLPPGRGRRWRTPIAAGLCGIGIAILVAGLVGGGSGNAVASLLGLGAVIVFLGVGLLSSKLVAPLASVVGRPLERLRGMTGRLARENTVRNPGRTAGTAAALMIGLALVNFVAIFAAGATGSVAKTIDDRFRSDLVLQGTDGFSPVSAQAGEAIARDPGVARATPLRFGLSKVTLVKGTQSVTAVDPKNSIGVFEFVWKQGSDRTLENLGPRDVVADEKWAKEQKFNVGETIAVLTPTNARLKLTIRGTYRDRLDFGGDFVVPLDVATRDFNMKKDALLLVKLAPGANRDAVQKRIELQLGAQFPDVEALTNEEFKDDQAKQLNQVLGLIYVLLGLSVLVSLFGIVNTLALSIHERTRELGMLRAIGTSRAQVRQMVRYESVITALIGAVLGTVLGVGFALIISRPLESDGFTLSFPVVTLLILIVLAAVAGVLAAIGPARRASRLDVLEALAYE